MSRLGTPIFDSHPKRHVKTRTGHPETTPVKSASRTLGRRFRQPRSQELSELRYKVGDHLVSPTRVPYTVIPIAQGFGYVLDLLFTDTSHRNPPESESNVKARTQARPSG